MYERLTHTGIVGYTSDMDGPDFVPFKLKNVIQKYPWGSKRLIPGLLGTQNPGDEPFAEMWMGVHPRGPSRLVIGEGRKIHLSSLIDEAPAAILGPDADKRFKGQLPFLFKVLAAGQPLSIQAHPDREQAEQGFIREEEQGVPVDDFQRNYRDRNHKPEILCALTPFTAMCGFREPQVIDSFYRKAASSVYERAVRPNQGFGDPSAWVHEFFLNLMKLTADDQRILTDDAVRWAENHPREGIEGDLILRFHHFFGHDVGVQAPFFLNVVSLEPGEALYQPAGVLHAYVEGMGVELMANSDNVLRGGLTRKHVDVSELLRVLSFEPRPADVLHEVPLDEYISYYDTPIDEFRLLRLETIRPNAVDRAERCSIEIGVCTDGDFLIKGRSDRGGEVLEVTRGDSFIVPFSFGEYTLHGTGTVYLAEIPGTKG